MSNSSFIVGIMLSEFVICDDAGIDFHKLVELTRPYLGVSDANVAENIIRKNKPILKINRPYSLQNFTKSSLVLVSYKPEPAL